MQGKRIEVRDRIGDVVERPSLCLVQRDGRTSAMGLLLGDQVYLDDRLIHVVWGSAARPAFGGLS